MPGKRAITGCLSISLFLASSSCALGDPPWIYGMHDPGGESHMGTSKGWIVFTEEIGHNPGDTGGGNYATWSNQGYGVIVRLNNGYGSAGTIPYEAYYGDFATRCANFVSHSSGTVLYWIIGNEMNGLREWPGNNDSNPAVGEPITVARYANCYTQCYNAIKNVAPSARVVPGAIGTWGPPYPAQGIEGFMDYWVNMLNAIGAARIDGLVIHTYTHGCDPLLVTDLAKMGPPYQDIYYNFQVYRQYMASIPTAMNTKPVLITECDQNIECADSASPRHAWFNTNNGWVRAVYSEINNWNMANAQKIRCLCLFRWPNAVEGNYTFGIQDRGAIIQDFALACAYGYQWSPPTPSAPTGVAATPGSAQVSLTWTASATATGYNVKRSSTAGGPYALVATPSTTSFVNTGLVNGTTYYYVVSAVNGSGESANSSQVDATPAGTGFPVSIQRGNGLANVFAKLNSGQSATIVYIGGSVTQNAGWRDNVTAWFNGKYPGKITEINAGWSGTGSLIGAMRFARDALAYGPDLIFVEFAINDLPEDPLLFVERNSEGFARQAWGQSQNIDVCFVETIASYAVPFYQSGQYPTPVRAHYAVADLYGNPSVNMGWQLYTHVLAGAALTDFLPDGAHPNTAGSAIYSNEAVIPYLESERTRGGSSALHSIPSTLTDYPVMSSTITDAASLTGLSPAWSKHYDDYGVSSFIQSGTAGSTVSLDFAGPAAAARIIVAPDGGGISYSVDGGAYAPGNVPGTGSPYVWAFPVAKNYSFGSHTLTLRVDSGVARIVNVEAANSTSVPPPAGTNLALSAVAAQADTVYGSGYEATKAGDGITSTKWTSTGATKSHWLACDLGSSAAVSTIIVKHASSGGEATYYNTKAFVIESGSSLQGPWSTESTGSNVDQAGSSRFDYTTPRNMRYVRLNISDPGIDNYARIPEFEIWGTSTTVPPGAAGEDFEVMPGWNSIFDAGWGNAASFAIVSGGQSGNALQASRSGNGSSARTLLYGLTPNTNYTLSVYIRCPAGGAMYWAETAYKLGNSSAQDFDSNAGTWTMVKKFADDGTNGNGDAWTQYFATFNSGSNTQVSVGFKLGSSGTNGPVVKWDQLRLLATDAAAKADFDRDADVDQDDFAHFQSCVTGASLGPPGMGCDTADLSGDGDVDQGDFGIFQRCLSGWGTQANPACAS